MRNRSLTLSHDPRTQEVTQDPRKVPFYFEYLFTEVADPRHEQVRPSVYEKHA